LAFARTTSWNYSLLRRGARAVCAIARTLRRPRRPAAPPPPRASEWSAEVLAAIEWRRFEAVCEKFFAQAGFETRSQSHGADGGVDIWLSSRHALGPIGIVQCRHWQGGPVRIKDMREFLGLMNANRITSGTYATAAGYTPDALRFARDNGINALDGAGLVALVARRTPVQQQELLDIAYEGEYWKPTCASCGVKMVARERKEMGTFWGCVNFPRCRNILHRATA
jgi:restriction system protein